MGAVTERLVRLSEADNRYDIPYAEIRDAQVEAVSELFQERKDKIKLLGHRAKEAGLSEVRSLEDVVPLLFPHTAYKSYPENWLLKGQWDRLGNWLNTVSTYPIEDFDTSSIKDIDTWIDALEKAGHFISCSSGTTGKSAMLIASKKDVEWWKKETISTLTWGTNVVAARDRRVVQTAPVAYVARNRFVLGAFEAALQDPNYKLVRYPTSPLTVGSLTDMVVLRKKIADGTALPGEIQAYEDTSAARQKEMDDAVGVTAEAMVEARKDKIHVMGLWAGAYAVAKAVRDMGYSAKDFRPENSISVGGGLKGAALPSDYREFVYETFNIAPENRFQGYGMQEIHSNAPRCLSGRYHVSPWVVPLLLNKEGDALVPSSDGEVEGRAAFLDLSIDGRWGGVISGDKISIDFSPCECGARSPSIRDDVVRYVDLEGDDKIGCSGTVDAYVRGVS